MSLSSVGYCLLRTTGWGLSLFLCVSCTVVSTGQRHAGQPTASANLLHRVPRAPQVEVALSQIEDVLREHLQRLLPEQPALSPAYVPMTAGYLRGCFFFMATNDLVLLQRDGDGKVNGFDPAASVEVTAMYQTRKWSVGEPSDTFLPRTANIEIASANVVSWKLVYRSNPPPADTEPQQRAAKALVADVGTRLRTSGFQDSSVVELPEWGGLGDEWDYRGADWDGSLKFANVKNGVIGRKTSKPYSYDRFVGAHAEWKPMAAIEAHYEVSSSPASSPQSTANTNPGKPSATSLSRLPLGWSLIDDTNLLVVFAPDQLQPSILSQINPRSRWWPASDDDAGDRLAKNSRGFFKWHVVFSLRCPRFGTSPDTPALIDAWLVPNTCDELNPALGDTYSFYPLPGRGFWMVHQEETVLLHHHPALIARMELDPRWQYIPFLEGDQPYGPGFDSLKDLRESDTPLPRCGGAWFRRSVRYVDGRLFVSGDSGSVAVFHPGTRTARSPDSDLLVSWREEYSSPFGITDIFGLIPVEVFGESAILVCGWRAPSGFIEPHSVRLSVSREYHSCLILPESGVLMDIPLLKGAPRQRKGVEWEDIDYCSATISHDKDQPPMFFTSRGGFGIITIRE